MLKQRFWLVCDWNQVLVEEAETNNKSWYQPNQKNEFIKSCTLIFRLLHFISIKYAPYDLIKLSPYNCVTLLSDIQLYSTHLVQIWIQLLYFDKMLYNLQLLVSAPKLCRLFLVSVSVLDQNQKHYFCHRPFLTSDVGTDPNSQLSTTGI